MPTTLRGRQAISAVLLVCCAAVCVYAIAIASVEAIFVLVALSVATLLTLTCPRVRLPGFYLAVLTIALPFQVYLNLGSIPLSTVYVFVGAAAATWMLAGVFSERWRVYFPHEIIPMVLFLLILLQTSINAADPRASMILGVQVIAYFIAFFVAGNMLDTEAKIRQTIRLLLVAATANAGLGIAQAVAGTLAPQRVVGIFFTGPLAGVLLGSRALQRLGSFGPEGPLILYRNASIEQVGNAFRAFGTFGGPTIYGWFTTTLAVFAFGFFLVRFDHGDRIKRIARWAAILSAMAVFLSWTRSAWVGLVVGIVLVITFRRARSVNLFSIRWAVFLLTAVMTLGLVVLVGSIFQDTLVGKVVMSAIGGENAAGSNAGRIQTARHALAYMRQHPFQGVGFGNYPYFASDGALDSTTATATTAHNTYLELGVELGILGVVMYIVVLLAVLVRSFVLIRQPRHSLWHATGVALAGVWVSFIVMLMFGGNIVNPKWMTCWWLLAGLQVGATRVIKRQAAEQAVALGTMQSNTNA